MNAGRLSYREQSAAANMALDHWMLSAVSISLPLLFRAYGWKQAAFTFGYTQKWREVQDYLDGLNVDHPELCRRPTGGGIVDHRNDWTYCIALHHQHPWSCVSPLALYKLLHNLLAEVISECAVPAKLYDPKLHEHAPLACFERPSPFDVLSETTGRKIAGAALKRSKNGILIQGSVAREPLVQFCDDSLEQRFFSALLHANADPENSISVSVPDPVPGIDLFRSEAWNLKR